MLRCPARLCPTATGSFPIGNALARPPASARRDKLATCRAFAIEPARLRTWAGSSQGMLTEAEYITVHGALSVRGGRRRGPVAQRAQRASRAARLGTRLCLPEVPRCGQRAWRSSSPPSACRAHGYDDRTRVACGFARESPAIRRRHCGACSGLQSQPGIMLKAAGSVPEPRGSLP